jgi:hypothetical protein
MTLLKIYYDAKIKISSGSGAGKEIIDILNN